jgi:aspartyl-tRNA(Asn)/glutamyl-tRNA(Gln) amidotransferase subunit C
MLIEQARHADLIPKLNYHKKTISQVSENEKKCYIHAMITIADIEKLALLARIALNNEEKKSLQTDISSILAYVDQIKQAAPQAMNSASSPIASINVFRDDNEAHESGIFTEELLSAAPQREGQYFKVKKIL